MRTVKVLSLLFVSLMLFQFYAVAPVANATPDSKLIPISGDVIISKGMQPLWPSHTSGNITHIFAYQSATFSESLVGDVVVYWHISQNTETGEMKTVGLGTFTGTLTFNDTTKSGTFTFITVGWGIGWTFYNEWRIIRGTDGLSHIHGKGTLDGDLSGYTGSYSGLVFFSP